MLPFQRLAGDMVTERQTEREREKHPMGRENRRLEQLKAAQGFLLPWLSGRK